MQLVYGSYSFDENEGFFSWTQREVLSATQRRSHYAIQVKWRGVKQGTSAADLTAKLQTLENAVASNNQDLKFYDNNGALTKHTLLTANTMNGVRVVGGVNYPGGYAGVWGPQTEYVHMRTYEIVWQAEISAPEADIMYYRESIRLLASGFSDFVVQESLSGVPQQQTTAVYTAQAVQQRGTAIGYEDYPSFPAYAYPVVYLKPRPYEAEEFTPEFLGRNGPKFFAIKWLFHYEAPTGLLLGPPLVPEL